MEKKKKKEKVIKNISKEKQCILSQCCFQHRQNPSKLLLESGSKWKVKNVKMCFPDA